jgi:hypothetical protein
MIDILAEVQDTKVNQAEWLVYFLNNHISLGLAFLLKHGVVEPVVGNVPNSEDFIEESFARLLEFCEVDEDTGFETLSQIVGDDFED